MNQELNEVYWAYTMYDVKEVKIACFDRLQNSVIVRDIILILKIYLFSTEGSHHIIQMIVMCHKSAQIGNMSRKMLALLM